MKGNPIRVEDRVYLSSVVDYFSLQLTRQDTSDGPLDDPRERQQGMKKFYRLLHMIMEQEGISGSLVSVSFDDASGTVLFHGPNRYTMSFVLYIDTREEIYILDRILEGNKVQRLFCVPYWPLMTKV